MYEHKIVVHPDAFYGSGYFSDSNWSYIEYQSPDDKWLSPKCPVGEHFAVLGFRGNSWDKDYILISQLTNAQIVDVPESFESVAQYLDWLKEVNIRVNEEDLGWIMHHEANVECKVMRNHNEPSGYVFPGGFLIVGKHSYATNVKTVRICGAKHTYQRFVNGDFFTDADNETYRIISTIPDLTTKEMQEAGIVDF